MTVRIARWSATHPWRAMALWTVFVVACIAVGALVGTKEATVVATWARPRRAEQIIDSGQFPPARPTERSW
jgi:RND superfamily putative drug exporter